MKKIEFIYENYVKDLCSSVKNVVIDEFLEEIIDDNTGEINLVFRDGNKLKVYASKDITVSEIQKFQNIFKFFNINLNFNRYNIIPFSNLIEFVFEVGNNE